MSLSIFAGVSDSSGVPKEELLLVRTSTKTRKSSFSATIIDLARATAEIRLEDAIAVLLNVISGNLLAQDANLSALHRKHSRTGAKHLR